MRQSTLFTKTRKEAPKDEVAKNAELLIRAGYIHKEMAGVYAYLPLGLKVFERIVGIIREEMNAIGGQEVELGALQQKETWEPTNQWDDTEVDVWFKTNLKNGTELGLAVTHEASLTKLMTEYVSSYKDLPLYVYQFQKKFRNETRAKSGILRTREFVMKDLYSFTRTEEEHAQFYENVKEAYKRIFTRVGIGEYTYLTRASGGMFSEFSHEFQTITDAGEDTIYIAKEDFGKGLTMDSTHAAFNKEIITGDSNREQDFEERKAVEVGNIFTLGTRFSEALHLTYKDESGNTVPVRMGSYGIGPGRLLGTIAELYADEKGLVWPEAVAPFRYHLVELSGGSEDIRKKADAIYETFRAKGIAVLYDDRDLRAGEKFADADLIGIPTRIVVGKKTEQGVVEVVDRKTGTTTLKQIDDMYATFS